MTINFMKVHRLFCSLNITAILLIIIYSNSTQAYYVLEMERLCKILFIYCYIARFYIFLSDSFY